MLSRSSFSPVDQIPSAGQLLLLQQAQQNAALAEQCKALADLLREKEQAIQERDKQLAGLAVRSGMPPDPGWGDPEKEKLRGLYLEQYAWEHYLPGTNHTTSSAVAEITHDLFTKINACFAEKPLLRDVRDSWVETFRNWLASQIGPRFKTPTANKYLRQLRAIYNYAVRKKVLRSLSPIDFLEENEPEINAWTPEENARVEEQARKQTGMVGPVPASVFWTAWALVFQKLGSRVTATMLSGRKDYDPGERALTLIRRNQKQKRDQRIILPTRAAAAVERLLAAHDHELIFGVWPFDPPVKKDGRRKWKVLSKHFEERLVKPAGLELQKGVKTRQLRRTAATICDENGGNPQELLGHSSPKTTELYKDKRRRRACRQSFFIPDADPQLTLFSKNAG